MLAGSRIKVILSQGGNERAKLVQYLFQQRRLSRLRIVVFLVVAALTAFGIVKLRLLQPVLLHHYNPRSRGKRGAQQQGAQPEDPAEDDGEAS